MIVHGFWCGVQCTIDLLLSPTDFQGSVSPQGLMGSFGLQKWGGMGFISGILYIC